MDPLDFIARLFSRLEGRNAAWPPESERATWAKIARRRAFMDGDRAVLAALAGWKSKADRRYHVDPLAGLITSTWADTLFGEDPVISLGEESGDDDLLTAILDGNPDLAEDLHRAAQVCSGEGEVWWRAFADEGVADVPLVEFHSRDVIVPFWIGRKLAAAAIVTELEGQARGSKAVFRMVEAHAVGVVVTRLYKGTTRTLGVAVDLSNHSETADLLDLEAEDGLEAVWEHGIPRMLMGRVRNPRGRDRRLGGSDLDPIEDQLLTLNEAATTGHENMRLTAKKRIIVPEAMVDPGGTSGADDLTDRGDGILVRTGATRPSFDASEEVYVATDLDKSLGLEPGRDFKALEYTFDAQPLIEFANHTAKIALTRIGLTPQSVGTEDGAGLAQSGTALRLRMIPETRTTKGKGRAWDGETPQIIAALIAVDALSVDEGGFGHEWGNPDVVPIVERSAGLPTDEVEAASVETALVGAKVRSRYQSVKGQHPDWTPEQVDEELGRIADDAPSASSFLS